jgi:tRNA(fMet)-specific endonuclease VapC
MRYLLDANTVIAAIRGHPIVLRHLTAVAAGDCALSTITRYELSVGVQKSADPVNERAKVDLLITTFNQVPFGIANAEEAARVRAYLEAQGTPIGPYDTLLAGHALSLSLIVVTANVKEFTRVPGLTVENWQA